MKRKATLKHTGAFWAFVAPCIILFGVFFLLPLVLSIAFSFTNYDGWKTMDFVALDNYIELFTDSRFYVSLGRTLLYTICALPFRVIIPLLVAVLLCSNRVVAKSLTRTMVYIPVLMSALVVGITINWMFSQEYGLVNFIIQCLGGQPLEWSLNPGLATFVIAFASVWSSIGFNMIIYIGGIAGISQDLYEAPASTAPTRCSASCASPCRCSAPPPSWSCCCPPSTCSKSTRWSKVSPRAARACPPPSSSSTSSTRASTRCSTATLRPSPPSS